MAHKKRRQAGKMITVEITNEMILAGLEVLFAYEDGVDPEKTVRDLFVAMLSKHPRLGAVVSSRQK